MKEYIQEFENINIVLSERAFREKLFRTKIKCLQGQIDKNIEYFALLMEEEIKEDRIEELREKAAAEKKASIKKAGTNFKAEGSRSENVTWNASAEKKSPRSISRGRNSDTNSKKGGA